MSSQKAPESGFEPSTNTSLREKNEDLEANMASMEKDGSGDNIVDWDGPDDPANPRCWSKTKKNVHIIVVSIFALVA